MRWSGARGSRTLAFRLIGRHVWSSVPMPDVNVLGGLFDRRGLTHPCRKAQWLPLLRILASAPIVRPARLLPSPLPSVTGTPPPGVTLHLSLAPPAALPSTFAGSRSSVRGLPPRRLLRRGDPPRLEPSRATRPRLATACVPRLVGAKEMGSTTLASRGVWRPYLGWRCTR